MLNPKRRGACAQLIVLSVQRAAVFGMDQRIDNAAGVMPGMRAALANDAGRC